MRLVTAVMQSLGATDALTATPDAWRDFTQRNAELAADLSHADRGR